MRHIFLLLSLIYALNITSAASDKPISFEQLPKKSQDLISSFFVKNEIVKISMDKELMDTEYEVVFSDGTKIEFDFNGVWKEIKAKGSCIADKILHPSIAQHINANHPEACIEEIERDKHKTKVELSTGVEMIFNNKGEFIRYDD